MQISADKNTTILYDYPIRTDRTIMANKPDIIIRGEKETIIIEVSVPADANLIEKEAEKMLKYKDLIIEIKRMWDTKVTFVPVIIGATGYVGNRIIEHISKIPGKLDFKIIQKTAILGSAHIIRKVLT